MRSNGIPLDCLDFPVRSYIGTKLDHFGALAVMAILRFRNPVWAQIVNPQSGQIVVTYWNYVLFEDYL